MIEITVKLQDDLLQYYGESFIKSYLEKKLEHLALFRIMDKIESRIKDSGLDYDFELESIREEAWREYKKDFLT